MELSNLEILDLLADFYKKNKKLPNDIEWRTIHLNLSYSTVVEAFGGKKRLETKVKFHINKRIWNIEKLKVGFQKFYDENGRYPTAPEIDSYAYLPSARSIQRAFNGGLKELRKLLDIEIIDYTTGEYRRKASLRYISEAIQSELDIRKFLDEIFSEICVHEEKKYGNGKNTADFFVYAQELNFGVDVFKTSTYRNLAQNLNIKLDKYKNFPHKLYFVVIGKFDQKKINQLIENKQYKPMSGNMSCVNIETFKEQCLEIKPLNIITPYIKLNP